jgi:predicted double-glycine peptidase
MTSTLRAKVGAAARSVGIVALLCAPAAASLVASAAAVHAASSTPVSNANHEVGMYGDPSAAAPNWRQQHSSDCGEMAVADVVGQITGHEPTEQQITALAKSTPSTAGAGSILNLPANTDIRDLPVLLAHYWIKADNIQTSINALEQDLAEKRRVIVLLNAETIWNRPGKRSAANHFVVVTGIDPKAGVVHLNDSGIMNGRDEQIPIATFEQAWAPNHNSAIVTK